jgi:hypothetical protein
VIADFLSFEIHIPYNGTPWIIRWQIGRSGAISEF